MKQISGLPGLEGNTYTFVQLDDTLTTAGKAADAKKTGDELNDLKSIVTDNQQTFFGFAGEVAPSVKISNDFINGRRYLSGGFANASGYAVSKFAYPAGKYAIKAISKGWVAFAYVSDSQGSAIVGNWTTSNYTLTASTPFYITFNGVSSDDIFNSIVASFDIRHIVNESGDSIKDDVDALDDRITAVEGQIGEVEDAVDGLTDKVNEIVVYDEPVNIFDNTFVEGEQVATSSGAFVEGSTFARTGYIPVKAGVVNIGVKTLSQPSTVFQHCALYDANKNKVSAFPYTGITVNNAGNLYYQTVTATVDGYIAFDILLTSVNYDYYVSQEAEPTGYKPYYEPREYINPDLLPDTQNAITASMTYGSKPPQKSAATLTSGQSLIVENNSIMKNQYMAFFAKIDGTFNGVTVGHGQESYGYYVAVDGTNMTYGSNGSAGTATAHGLTIEEYIGVIIEVDVELNINTTIISKGGYFTKSQQINSSWRGNVFATSNGTSFADAVLTWYTNDYKCPLWAFGDSYFTLYSPTRWPYYVANKWGYNNILLNAYPGEASTRAYDDLTNALTHGTPKYILWCMGMNDPDTGSAVNATWLEKVSALLDVCNQKGITPILATIPEVTNTSYKNTYKNNWIRSSGVRYVDFASALADVSGWLSDDGVHPSEIGGRFMALKVLADVPEIAQGK
jgi:hypothetical protein